MTHTLTMASGNAKTGPIPVSTSPRSTCPDSCALKGSGCYAEHGPLSWYWKRISQRVSTMAEWSGFLNDIKRIPRRALWRFAQAGDLPGHGDRLDVERLRDIVRAQAGRRGFTYTHKPLTSTAEIAAVRDAVRNGFTINLSADTLAGADWLAERAIAPVVVLLQHGASGKGIRTPAGRRVVVCPAYKSERVTCQSCELCALPSRDYIIGFPAHGVMRAKANRIAMSEEPCI